MSRIFIIAEAGVNHNGDINLALQLVEAASNAGADAIKFQIFNAAKLVTKSAAKAEYQKKQTGKDESQFEMIRKLELSREEHKELQRYCENKNIHFLSSPFDEESAQFLNVLGLRIFKIPSGEITNLPYLKRIGELNKKIILSTGMANLSEVESAINVLVNSGTARANITLLHCNTEYPTPFIDVNLNAMLTLKDAFKLPVGYSDHTIGIEIPIAAAALGATVIEKHFTLDKSMKGPDHKASLNPLELKTMVQSIRNIEVALGSGIKQPSNSELKNITAARKSIVANKAIKKGEVFTEKNITVKRPGMGLSPMHWDKVIGRKAVKDFKEDDLIKL